MSAEPESFSDLPPLPDLVVNTERLQEVTSLEVDEVRALMDLYFSQAEECIPRLQQSVSSGDLADATRTAHKLAGSSLSCGLDRIGQLFRFLERACIEENQAKASSLAASIDAEFASVRAAIAKFLADTNP